MAITQTEIEMHSEQSSKTLSDADQRAVMELLFFAYRDFTGAADAILQEIGFGRAHHRVIYFTARQPGLSVSELLDILRITKQSLNRVLSQLVREGFILQETDTQDRRRRQLYLTDKGRDLDSRLAATQGELINKALGRLDGEAALGFRRGLEGLMTSADFQNFRKGLD